MSTYDEKATAEIEAATNKSIMGADTLTPKKLSQADRLVDLVENDKNIELFHDDLNEPFAQININGHKEILKCRSRLFKLWLVRLFREIHGKVPNTDSLNTAIMNIEGEARFKGRQYQLAIRVTRHNDAIWYDLTDKEWRAVKITAEGWSIENNPPILFQRYPHHQDQVEPAQQGDVQLALNLVNIQDENTKILFLVYLVSCFIPTIPHPIPNVYGSQGSAKSTFSKIVKKLVDPSKIEVSDFPTKKEELIQKMAHNWLLFFDNVSNLPQAISDMLCRAVTGSGFMKRELYTDDEDIIYSFKRCIGINGIDLAASRPDLLERSILFELERVPKEKRRQEEELDEMLERDKAKILAGIFDTLSKSMKIHPSMRLPALPRMADFTMWGCAIAEALGYSTDRFLTAYYENINFQNEEVLHANLEAVALMEFMKGKTVWEGTASELLEELETAAVNSLGINIQKEKSFPKA